jgi:hypothetical protein
MYFCFSADTGQGTHGSKGWMLTLRELIDLGWRRFSRPCNLQPLGSYRLAGFLASGLYPIKRHTSLALNAVDSTLVMPVLCGGAVVPCVAAH